MKDLSKSAQAVQDVLNKNNITAQVIEMPASTRSAAEAAQTIGCSVEQIVKSLIFRIKNSNDAILVLASGPNRVNEKIIAHHRGQEIEKADADFVREITGFAIGGIPPIGHKTKIETYIDEDLLKYPEVWAAAGTPNAVFCLQSSKLQQLTNGKVITIK